MADEPSTLTPLKPVESHAAHIAGASRAIRGGYARWLFWQKLGGEGLTISLLIHLILIFIAAIWVISTVNESAKKTPNAFSIGHRGDATGDRSKQFKSRAPSRNPKATAKNTTRITAKNANAETSLPDLPTSSAFSLNTGKMGGVSTKGFGIGGVVGVDRGNSKNFVSVFGSKTQANGLPGSFYDFKQDKSGKPTNLDFTKEVNVFFEKGFAQAGLNKVFRAPGTLFATQFFIPTCPAEDAPKAYGVENECKPSRWIAHYKGAVRAPQTGKFRFVGSGDDFLVVRWNRKVALDSGFEHHIVGAQNIYKDFGNKKCDDIHPSKLGRPLRAGPWINITKDAEVPLEVVVGETPGGSFYAILCIEVMAPNGKAEGSLKLFRLTTDELPDSIKNGHGSVPGVDMAAEGWIFKPAKAAAAR